jgi:hypothetical protein
MKKNYYLNFKKLNQFAFLKHNKTKLRKMKREITNLEEFYLFINFYLFIIIITFIIY